MHCMSRAIDPTEFYSIFAVFEILCLSSDGQHKIEKNSDRKISKSRLLHALHPANTVHKHMLQWLIRSSY